MLCLLPVQVPGLVNVDFADVRAIMQGAGSSLMGQGRASGAPCDSLQLCLCLTTPWCVHCSVAGRLGICACTCALMGGML